MWKKWAFLLVVSSVLSGCVTQGKFVIPKDTQLEVYKRSVSLQADGRAVMRPFFWTAAGMPPNSGVPYRLLKDGHAIQEGHLRAKFRPVSIFWPPFAIIYWPMGLNPDITYDLIKGTQE